MISILALFLQAAAPAAAPAPWTVTPRPNADPTITSTVLGTPSSDGNATLRLRCDSGKERIVSVQLFTKTPLGGPPDRPVTFTIDGGTPMGSNWEFVEKGAYVRDDMAVTTLTTAIAGGKVIKVHTTTAQGEPIDATFAGPPSAAPVTTLLAGCGYTLGTPPVRAPLPAATPAPK
ncbi:MAG: hypothetical protein E7773_15240 [Sphingomonas sp.]|uniref:hypothetical protein n=1 Tax=Sphingomonas sp. TaxID=28214 RepID=UPI0011FEFC2F|nr:hypothetical protein [Sphingomonas sp.]THD34536.1 MAG: hypothetical protein E7773_15240 [Sphingomonas sp.]